MQLSITQSYLLLDRFGVFSREACDLCGQILGHVRFTRQRESGVWCSRQCRDGIEAREPGSCRQCRAKLPDGKRRGAVFCDDACRKAFRRQNDNPGASPTLELSRTKPSIYADFLIEKEQVGISGHPRVVGDFQDLIGTPAKNPSSLRMKRIGNRQPSLTAGE